MFQTSNLLSPFTTDIILSGDTYVITYKNDEYVGNVIYREHNMTGVNKPIRQKVYMIISSDMGDVIEYIHKKTPLSPERFNEVQMGIRTHSLTQLINYFTLP